MWGPHGSTLTQPPRRIKPGSKPSKNLSERFCKLTDIIYLVLRLGNDFVTRWQVDGPLVFFFLVVIEVGKLVLTLSYVSLN
jgi:hypothetical protein